MLSPLARGYGSWTGDIDLCQSKSHTNDCFPTVGYPDPHRHGVTISPRGPVSTPSTAQTSHKTRFEPTDGKIPKTFLTRKGALLLFTAPDNGDKPESLGERTFQKNRKGKKLLDLSLKLGTIDRLCKSVLQYGDESYDRENSSITDPHNRFFLKFIRQTSELDDGGFDIHSQPGGELGFYLRDLKTRASSRIYSDGDPRSRTKSPELRELLRDLDGALPRTGRSVTLTDFTESQRGSPKQRVLSSKKLTASIKSSTYLGRPTSAGTKSSVSAANLPRIASQSSVKSRSRTSSKSGLWVQGYDETAKTEPRSTKPNSAASTARHSVHDTSISDSYIAMQDTEPALQTEEDATSAAEEQEIVLPSDAEEDDGFGAEEDNWPAVDEKEQNADEEQDTLSMTQPLQPQYNATGLMQDLEVPLEEDVDEDQLAEEQQEDDQKVENGNPDDQTGISPQEKDVNQIEGTMEEQDDTRSVEATEQEIPLAEGNIKDSTNTETSEITTPERDQCTATQNTDMATACYAEHDTLKSTSTEPEEQAPAESGNSPAAGAEAAGQPGEASTEPPSTSAHPLISAAQPTQAVSTDTAVAPSPGPHSAEVLQSLSPVSGVKSVSPSPSIKARVTFDEKVTKQAAPKTPPHSVKQSVPPKAKPPVRPQTRILSKGSNNKKAGKQPNKSFVKAIEITSVQPEEEQKDETEAVTVAPPEKQARQKLPPARHVETLSDKTKSSVLPSHMEELLNRRSTSKSQEELENEMAQMSEAVEITLAGPTLLVDTGEGLTEEELKLAQEALLERVKQAESQMEDVAKKEVKKPQAPVKVVQPKSRKKKNLPVEEKRNLQQEQAAIREQRKREKLQRLEEAKQLQEKIKAREAERKAKEKEAKKKAQQLAEEIQDLKREEDEIQQAEEDARYQLALARKVEREAREQRRRDDLERKKQEAIRRREKEKQMMEVARQKEEEMLKRIADNEMKRQLQEEEMRKREEEERLAQEQYEEELRQAQREAEEEELRLRELEKEAEEEAMQRLIEEREEAERRRWKLNELARQMEEEEQRKRELMLEEERKLEAEKRKREEEEQQKLEEERKRLEELHRMEAEARENMRVELIRRREWALKRREANLERRENLDNTRHGQGITRAWVFSYFPDWPLESYNKPMGEDAKSKKGFRPQPKPKPKPKTDETEAPAPSGETTQKT